MTGIQTRLYLMFLALGSVFAASPSAGQDNVGGKVPPLLVAAQDDVVADVIAQLHARANVNARDEFGATALAWATIRNNPDIVQKLLAAGANPNLVDTTGVGPLSLAVANDAANIVDMLLQKGANPNSARGNGETPFMTAVRMASPTIVQMLLAHGGDVNSREDRFDQTALMWATGRPEIVRMLLNKGADPKPVTKSWEITATNYTPITFTLGVTGIPWNNSGEYRLNAGGDNALHFAVLKDDFESVRMLLDAGTDVNHPAADGTTPLLAALYHWRPDGAHGLKFSANLPIANLLLDRGAKVEVSDQAGYTPLHAALLSLVLRDADGGRRLAFNPALKCDPDRARPKPSDDEEALVLVKRLLDAGADPNSPIRLATPGPVNLVRINPAPIGSTPFLVAAAARSVRIVNLLAERGGDPNRVRQDGHTPFSIAVMNDDLPVVEAMVAHGADLEMRYSPIDEISDPVEPKTQKRRNQTILHIAAVSGAEWVVPYLARHGVPLNATNDHGETPFALADAQELYRFRKDSEGNGRGTERKPPRRETQTSSALNALMRDQLPTTAIQSDRASQVQPP